MRLLFKEYLIIGISNPVVPMWHGEAASDGFLHPNLHSGDGSRGDSHAVRGAHALPLLLLLLLLLPQQGHNVAAGVADPPLLLQRLQRTMPYHAAAAQQSEGSPNAAATQQTTTDPTTERWHVCLQWVLTLLTSATPLAPSPLLLHLIGAGHARHMRGALAAAAAGHRRRQAVAQREQRPAAAQRHMVPA